MYVWESTKAILPSRSCRPCRRLATGSVSWCRQCAWCHWHWGAVQLRSPGNCCLVCELKQREKKTKTCYNLWKASNMKEMLKHKYLLSHNSHKPISTSVFSTDHNSREVVVQHHSTSILVFVSSIIFCPVMSGYYGNHKTGRSSVQPEVGSALLQCHLPCKTSVKTRVWMLDRWHSVIIKYV